jgi:hypothetical protein
MFKNYLTIALRNMMRNKLFISVHVLGLGLVIAMGIIARLNCSRRCCRLRYRECFIRCREEYYEKENPVTFIISVTIIFSIAVVITGYKL